MVAGCERGSDSPLDSSRYMGYIRQLKPRRKAIARAAKEKERYRAGIAVAKRLAARE